MNNNLKYPYIISTLSEEDGGGYLIEFPDLPGCVSDGETPEEAIMMGKDAVEAWLNTAKECDHEVALRDRTIPNPTWQKQKLTL